MTDKIIKKIEGGEYKNKELILSLIYNIDYDKIFNGGIKNNIKIFYNILYNEIYNLITKYNFKKENIYIFDNYYIFNIEDNMIKNIFIYKKGIKPNIPLSQIIKGYKI